MGDWHLTRGLTHVYTGSGKGKTSAALGVALRVIGQGGKVCIVQFIKGYPDISEALFARNVTDRLTLWQFAADMSRDIDEAKVLERRKAVGEAMDCSERAISGGEYDLVICDELVNAIHYGLVDQPRVLRMIAGKPSRVELILTGRGASEELIEAADYVTEMTPIKHPYEKGIPARKGIDF